MDKALIVSYVVEATLEGIPCEVSLLDKDGNEVGFWAYGAFTDSSVLCPCSDNIRPSLHPEGHSRDEASIAQLITKNLQSGFNRVPIFHYHK